MEKEMIKTSTITKSLRRQGSMVFGFKQEAKFMYYDVTVEVLHGMVVFEHYYFNDYKEEVYEYGETVVDVTLSRYGSSEEFLIQMFDHYKEEDAMIYDCTFDNYNDAQEFIRLALNISDYVSLS